MCGISCADHFFPPLWPQKDLQIESGLTRSQSYLYSVLSFPFCAIITGCTVCCASREDGDVETVNVVVRVCAEESRCCAAGPLFVSLLIEPHEELKEFGMRAAY